MIPEYLEACVERVADVVRIHERHFAPSDAAAGLQKTIQVQHDKYDTNATSKYSEYMTSPGGCSLFLYTPVQV